MISWFSAHGVIRDDAVTLASGHVGKRVGLEREMKKMCKVIYYLSVCQQVGISIDFL